MSTSSDDTLCQKIWMSIPECPLLCTHTCTGACTVTHMHIPHTPTHTYTQNVVLPVSITRWNILLILIKLFGVLFICNTNRIHDGEKPQLCNPGPTYSSNHSSQILKLSNSLLFYTFGSILNTHYNLLTIKSCLN